MKKFLIILSVSFLIISAVSCGSDPTIDTFVHTGFEMKIPKTWSQLDDITNPDGSFEVFFEKQGAEDGIQSIRFNLYPDSQTISFDEEELTVSEMMENMKAFFENKEDISNYEIAGINFERHKFVSFPNEENDKPYTVTIHNAMVGDDLVMIITGTFDTEIADDIYTTDQLIMFDTLKFKDISKINE